MKGIRIFVFALFITMASGANAQLPGGPPNPPGQVHGVGGDQAPGGGAPLQSGVWFLLGISMIYGVWKAYPGLSKLYEINVLNVKKKNN